MQPLSTSFEGSVDSCLFLLRLQSCSLSTLQARLKVAAHQAEEESEDRAENFLEGRTDIDEFLTGFMEKRTVRPQPGANMSLLSLAQSTRAQRLKVLALRFGVFDVCSAAQLCHSRRAKEEKLQQSINAHGQFPASH